MAALHLHKNRLTKADHPDNLNGVSGRKTEFRQALHDA
jgi:hypothetical protein